MTSTHMSTNKKGSLGAAILVANGFEKDSLFMDTKGREC